jgi:hypothetical protein
MTARHSALLRNVLVALGSILISAGYAFCIALTLFNLGRSHLTYDTLAGPAFLALLFTTLAGLGAAAMWRSAAWLLGAIAALPYLAMSGLLLSESRTDGVLFWTAAAVVTFLLYAGPSYIRILTSRNNVC